MKTPQDKKRLSLAKDRRNTFGENSKASRKSIPLAKARANRSERHAQDHLLAQTGAGNSEEQLVAVEVQVRSTKPRQWRKSPDEALGVVLAKKSERRGAA